MAHKTIEVLLIACIVDNGLMYMLLLRFDALKEYP